MCSWLGKIQAVKELLVDKSEKARPDVDALACAYIYLQVSSSSYRGAVLLQAQSDMLRACSYIARTRKACGDQCVRTPTQAEAFFLEETAAQSLKARLCAQQKSKDLATCCLKLSTVRKTSYFLSWF